MTEYDKYKGQYIIELISILISVILFVSYLSLVLFYIFKNYHRKKLCIFWIDYCILIFGCILFYFMYLIYLFTYKNNTDIRKAEPYKLPKKVFPPSIVIFLSFICFTLIATLIFDSIISIRLSIKLKQMKQIKEKELDKLSNTLNNIDYVDILKMESHHIYSIVFLIINLLIIGLEIFYYLDITPGRYGTPWNLISFFNNFLRFYHLIVLAFLIVSIVIMNYFKKSLLEENYYNQNRIAQKVYDAHFSQIIYFTDVLSFKLVADLIMNIPPLIFMATGRFNVWNLILSEIAIFSYIFLGGNAYLTIDKNSKAGKMNKFIKNFFCLKKSDFHFGEKDVKAIIDEFKFDYSEKEKSILNSLNINIIKNIEYNLSKDENDKSLSNIELQTTS